MKDKQKSTSFSNVQHQNNEKPRNLTKNVFNLTDNIEKNEICLFRERKIGSREINLITRTEPRENKANWSGTLKQETISSY